jgi:UDP-glucose 6-dehydrogenase
MEKTFTEHEIMKYGEVNYLRGRLDELLKAIQTITNLSRQRKVDARIMKYFDKLYIADKVSYLQYNCELSSRHRVKMKEISDRNAADLNC